ncbi:hypothetical protein [uncultured Clostridium sp.]|uniref:TIGR03943 family putative permease subunit n=1 Tax=uncultured Clostridium sp. TaxID=59620 RepID=UPI0025E8EDB0|nr:hypothetical protein [uncultured Clostridium sp.]
MKKKIITIFLLSVFSFLAACSIGNDHANEHEQKVTNTAEDNIGNKDIESSKDDSEKDNVKTDVKNDEIVISDENFITDMDRIFADVDNYVGRTMKVEGFIGAVEGSQFKILRLYDMAHEDHSHEITVGINAVYDGEIPAEDTWIEVFGTITKGNVEGREQPVLKVEKLEKKFTHGQTKVYN